MRRITLTLLLVLLPLAARAEVLSQWVQWGPKGSVEARAVFAGEHCPFIVVDGADAPMAARAAADGNFPLLCSAGLPSTAKSISLLGVALPVPVQNPKRIVVLGDTGCRIKGGFVQACSDPAKWPFPAIAAQAARLKPDLVLHVGDYLYRETPCPKDRQAMCGDSPSGDNWPSWAADFFTPAAPLLTAAPFVFVRGNHEDCARAGPGWLRLLGPAAYDSKAACGHIAPYAVPLGAMSFVVMDDASAPDHLVDIELAKTSRADFASLSGLAPASIWLALHRPLWGAVKFFGFTVGGNRTLISALNPAHLAPVELMLSGHIHAFEALNYRGKLPPQLVAGHGGDVLNSVPADLSGYNLSGQMVTDGVSMPGFGFLLMTQREDGWRIDVYGVDGAIRKSCHFANRRVDCPKT